MTDSPFIEQELKSRGVAQVIVVMKPQEATGGRRARSAAASSPVESLSSHFVFSEHSAAAAIMRSKAVASPRRRAGSMARGAAPDAVKYYPSLGVMLGTVTREGLAALKAAPEVADVSGTP